MFLFESKTKIHTREDKDDLWFESDEFQKISAEWEDEVESVVQDLVRQFAEKHGFTYEVS